MDLAGLLSLLTLTKQLPQSTIDEQFYKLMLKAKQFLGEESYPMGHFYYQYANFLLGRMERNNQIFNNGAVPQNVQEDAEMDGMEEVFQDSQPADQLEVIGEENQGEGQGEYKEEGMKRKMEEPNNQPEIIQDGAESGPQVQPQPQPQAQDSDDKQICYINFQYSIKIFQLQLLNARKGISHIDINQILDKLRRAHTRLGDLYLLDQQYPSSISQYRGVIQQQMQRQGCQSNRLIADLHHLIGIALLFDNKQNCQKLAISEYVNAIRILVQHLASQLGYDISGIQRPTQSNVKVDRFGYLAKPYDSQGVKEIKEVLGELLNKLEQTFEQIGVREVYESEKKKLQEQKDGQVFKPVAETQKVVNLGSFGNRKKKPQVEENKQTGLNASQGVKKELEKEKEQKEQEQNSENTPQ